MPQCVAADKHDLFQAQAPKHTSSQHYVHKEAGRSPQGGQGEKPNVSRDPRKLAPTTSTIADTCEQIHANAVMGPLRIGYELIDVDNVPRELVDFVNGTVMEKAVAYWSAALQVHRAVLPLKAERQGLGCRMFSFDTEFHCNAVVAPQCGIDGFTIPDKYLKAQRSCTKRCSPEYQCMFGCFSEGTCHCNVDEWAAQRDSYCCQVMSPQSSACPSGCSTDTALFIGNGLSGGPVCEGGCTDAPEGEGVEGEDLHIFVTIADSPSCLANSGLQAYSVWCVKDQCDRPVFSIIHFCQSRLRLDSASVGAQVSTAVHEMAHSLGFSSSLFKYFRAPDGSPLIPRSPTNQDVFPNAVDWSCDESSETFRFPDANGGSVHVDVSPTIVNKFNERGFNNCQCPIGTNSMTAACLVPLTGWRLPSCVMRIVTPTVLAEARAHFGCPELAGAELENQDSGTCVILGSHWEGRVFNGEVMEAWGGNIGVSTYMSRVTLALFTDTGWYRANLSVADKLTKGVHWGYQQGCAFAEQRCVSNGVPVGDRAFCTTNGEMACSLDRTHVRGCRVLHLSNGAPPTVFNYLGTNDVGTLAELDYCPTYAARITGRSCTDTSSVYSPYADMNFMREVFGTSSRCLDSNLNGRVRQGDRSYAAAPDLFAQSQPTCYEIVCSPDSSAYNVHIWNGTGGTQVLGTCYATGQQLASTNISGSVTCAAPEEICQVALPMHNTGNFWRTTFSGIQAVDLSVDLASSSLTLPPALARTSTSFGYAQHVNAAGRYRFNIAVAVLVAVGGAPRLY